MTAKAPTDPHQPATPGANRHERTGRLGWAARAFRAVGALALAWLVGYAGHSIAQWLWLGRDAQACPWPAVVGASLALWANLYALRTQAHCHPHAGWAQWIETRVQARAGLWMLALGPLALLTPLPNPSIALSCACGVAALLGRYGPSFGTNGLAAWQRSPLGALWGWLCPPLSVDGCLAWRRVVATLLRDHPDLAGQMIVAHHAPRLLYTPASIHEDLRLLIGRADPMVLLRPEGRRMGSAPAGQPGHQMIYKMHYGGVSAHGNRYEMATHPVWLDGWLACMHGRDPIPGEAWSIARPHTAHGLLEAAFLRATAASPHGQEKATQAPAPASGGWRPRPHPEHPTP